MHDCNLLSFNAQKSRTKIDLNRTTRLYSEQLDTISNRNLISIKLIETQETTEQT